MDIPFVVIQEKTPVNRINMRESKIIYDLEFSSRYRLYSPWFRSSVFNGRLFNAKIP